MTASPETMSRAPRWYFIPIRVLLVTTVVSLLSFAISLLLGICAVVLAAKLHHIHPDLRIAYRLIAAPAAGMVAAIVLVSASFMEVRHYRRLQVLRSHLRASLGARRNSMKPRIAIPLPHGSDPEYALRAIPQYERAVELSGAEAVRIPLDRTPAEVMKLIERCDGVLLPGSKADVDPAKFDAERDPKTAAADPKRDTVDELLLQDAYNMHKPVLGICYGLQILNVYRSGTLVQHIESRVNHEAGREVPVAHEVEVERGSRLAATLADPVWGQPPSAARLEGVREGFADNAAGNRRGSLDRTAGGGHPHTDTGRGSESLNIPVNSSHHQSADIIGDGLKIVARCPEDGIIEALEGTSPDHFVLAVQWHPERSFDDDENSKAIFKALVEAAGQKHRQLVGEFEGQSNAGEGARARSNR